MKIKIGDATKNIKAKFEPIAKQLKGHLEDTDKVRMSELDNFIAEELLWRSKQTRHLQEYLNEHEVVAERVELQQSRDNKSRFCMHYVDSNIVTIVSAMLWRQCPENKRSTVNKLF